MGIKKFFSLLLNREALISHPYICITGDTHGNIDWQKLDTKYFPEQKQMTREDLLIIAGDFGCVWHYPDENGNEEKSDKYLLDTYENRNFTTVFVDGNHENHEALADYPETEFLGAKCNQVRPHVYHVKRGEVLHIGGHKIWCMGGAESHDKEWRTPYKSWWPEEVPSEKEWAHAEETLRREQPDIIVTHEAPYSALNPIGVGSSRPTRVSKPFDRILDIITDEQIPVEEWYFGHHHQDKVGIYKGIKFRCLYQTIEAVTFS
jgi:hypothetical protein